MLLLFAPAAAVVTPPFPDEGTVITVLSVESQVAVTDLGSDDVTVL
ncbi:hypothetical protein AHiyo6_01220 [Arthrobacter sp. Hiyo6]|nr:hypothetical protein AHiyo6_01220 [Arthrobacter sp. Hiyo6]